MTPAQTNRETPVRLPTGQGQAKGRGENIPLEMLAEEWGKNKS